MRRMTDRNSTDAYSGDEMERSSAEQYSHVARRTFVQPLIRENERAALNFASPVRIDLECSSMLWQSRAIEKVGFETPITFLLRLDLEHLLYLQHDCNLRSISLTRRVRLASGSACSPLDDRPANENPRRVHHRKFQGKRMNNRAKTDFIRSKSNFQTSISACELHPAELEIEPIEHVQVYNFSFTFRWIYSCG